MGTTLTATFETRREAEMTVERLVQEHGVERTDVFIVAEGDKNRTGEDQVGSDGNAGQSSLEPRGHVGASSRQAVSGPTAGFGAPRVSAASTASANLARIA